MPPPPGAGGNPDTLTGGAEAEFAAAAVETEVAAAAVEPRQLPATVRPMATPATASAAAPAAAHRLDVRHGRLPPAGFGDRRHRGMFMFLIMQTEHNAAICSK